MGELAVALCVGAAEPEEAVVKEHDESRRRQCASLR